MNAPAIGSPSSVRCFSGRCQPRGRTSSVAGLLDQLVVAAVGAVVGDRALDRVDQVDVALDLVAPGRRVGVLEVGHEALGAAVERVDDELAVGRAGDLDAAVRVVGPRRRDLPVAVADLAPSPSRKPDGLPRCLRACSSSARRGAEAFLQLADEGQRLVGEDRPRRRRSGVRRPAALLTVSLLATTCPAGSSGDRSGRSRCLAICSAQPGLAAAIASAPVSRRFSALRAPSSAAASGWSRL